MNSDSRFSIDFGASEISCIYDSATFLAMLLDSVGFRPCIDVLSKSVCAPQRCFRTSSRQCCNIVSRRKLTRFFSIHHILQALRRSIRESAADRVYENPRAFCCTSSIVQCRRVAEVFPPAPDLLLSKKRPRARLPYSERSVLGGST